MQWKKFVNTGAITWMETWDIVMHTYGPVNEGRTLLGEGFQS